MIFKPRNSPAPLSGTNSPGPPDIPVLNAGPPDLRAMEELLKKQLGWSFFLRVVFLSLILGITAVLEVKGHRLTTDKYHYPLLLIAGVFLFTIASASLLTRIGNLRRFATLQLIFDILLISSLVLFSGTSQSLFTVVYFLPIIAGSFMLSQRGALLMAAISTLAYGAMLLLEYSRYDFNLLVSSSRQDVGIERLLNLFAINGLSFFFVAALAATLSARLYRTEAALSRTATSFDHLCQLYKQIFDDITTGIVTVNGGRFITSFNGAAEKISGYQAWETVGRRLESIIGEIKPPGDPAATVRAQSVITRKDGVAIPIDYAWSRLFGRESSEESYILSMQDLSQIKEMEAKVRQSEKMAAVGEMAAGVAHEFRNPLAAISGSAQLLVQRLQDNPVHGKLLSIITRECDRLENAIGNFLLFSRPATPNPEWLDIGELFRESIATIQQTPACTPDHHLMIECDQAPDIWADEEQLRRVLLNLLGNACQAMPHGGEIKCIARKSTNLEQPGAIIQVSDQGIGISSDLRPRIFDPYFTTRPEGTGLGLAIVHQLIISHGGQIEVHSTPESGTVFTIFLPEKRR